MAYSLSGEQPIAAARGFNPAAGIAAWFAGLRRHRTQRLTLRRLLEYDAAMLDDLGLSRQDVIDAMKAPPGSVGDAFAARRAARSRHWHAG